MAALIELIADPRTILVGRRRIRLTDEQARAILALTLSRLTGLGREEIFEEARGLAAEIKEGLDILASRERVMAIVRQELVEVREAFAVPRRTTIVEGDADVDDEDLITREDMVITVTHGGYVKRTPLATYRTQRRGGKGRSGMATKEEDAVTRVFSASTHAPVLFFSSGGKVYKLKVWRLPLGLPDLARQGLHQPPADRARRDHHLHPAAAGGRGELGAAGRDVRHPLGHRPPQQAVGLRAGEPRRQDRHEAGRGRLHHRRRPLHDRQRRAADHRARPLHPLPGR